MTGEIGSGRSAARRGDWKTEPMPERHETFVLARSFSDREMDALLAAFACGRINGKRLSAMRKYVWMVSLFFSLFSILMFILKGSY